MRLRLGNDKVLEESGLGESSRERIAVAVAVLFIFSFLFVLFEL